MFENAGCNHHVERRRCVRNFNRIHQLPVGHFGEIVKEPVTLRRRKVARVKLKAAVIRGTQQTAIRRVLTPQSRMVPPGGKYLTYRQNV